MPSSPALPTCPPAYLELPMLTSPALPTSDHDLCDVCGDEPAVDWLSDAVHACSSCSGDADSEELATEGDLETLLIELVEQLACDPEAAAELGAQALVDARADSYDAAGLLTHNKGLVLTLDSGTQFQIQIVRSA